MQIYLVNEMVSEVATLAKAFVTTNNRTKIIKSNLSLFISMQEVTIAIVLNCTTSKFISCACLEEMALQYTVYCIKLLLTQYCCLLIIYNYMSKVQDYLVKKLKYKNNERIMSLF